MAIRDGEVGIDLPGVRGSLTESVDAETDGTLTMYVNLAYLIDAVSNVKDSDITLSIQDSLKPMLVTGDDVRMVIMPVRRS